MQNGEIYNYEIGNFAITHIQLRTASKAFAQGDFYFSYSSAILCNHMITRSIVAEKFKGGMSGALMIRGLASIHGRRWMV